MAVQKSRKLPSIYLLLAEFSVRTVNYGSSFFFHRSVIYSTDRKNEANKMFIIWLLPVLGDRKQVQDARFDNHLTGVKKESFYWLTKTRAHDRAFPRK